MPLSFIYTLVLYKDLGVVIQTQCHFFQTSVTLLS